MPAAPERMILLTHPGEYLGKSTFARTVDHVSNSRCAM
jgi:hypothetical protein